MNIEVANSLSSLPANNTTKGGVQPLTENGAVPEAFSNALMGQMELLNEANGQAELAGQLQSAPMSQTIINLNDTGDLLKKKGGEEEHIALLDKNLLQSDKKNETVDLDAKLLALTDILKAVTPSINPDNVVTADNLSDAIALNGLAFEKPLPTAELTDVLKAITPSINLDNVVTADNLSDAIALNGLAFVKPLPTAEASKLNILGEKNVVSRDFLQKEAVLRQPILDGQGFNLQFLENAEPTEKTLMLKKQPSILGLENTAPVVTTDTTTFQKPADNRADSLAITKSLTHPDWSKDLGGQIVWMNNKAIPAAEIKLNPEHLGPMSVRIDVNKDQATIMFTTEHAGVKEAIEASIPKLREMLSTQQLHLVNVNVSHNSTSDQGRSQSQAFSKTPENYEQGIDGVTSTIDKVEHDRVVVSKGLLSLYA